MLKNKTELIILKLVTLGNSTVSNNDIVTKEDSDYNSRDGVSTDNPPGQLTSYTDSKW
jgi:hypothetical protein